MHNRGCTILWAVVLSLASARAGAQEDSDAAQLQELLQVQRAANEKLLQRLDAVEADQGALLERLQSLETSIPDGDAWNVEREAMLEEIRDEYFDLQDRLDALPTLSGYYDFEYYNDDREDSPGEFRQHRLTLFVTKEWESWRLFSEIEFEYGAAFEGDGGTELEEARGEVELEQAWGEYIPSDALALRGGLIFTPGYWNVNHYPNVVLTTRSPLMVGKVFRESFVGVMAYGDKYWDDLGVTYYGYVGNGQSAFFSKEDDNEGKAVGGKVSFHLPSKGTFDTLDLGLSMYHESPSGEDRLFTWGLDAQVRKGPWEVLTELARKDAQEDGSGFYIQPSYRFNEKWATYYRYDLLSIEHDGETQEHTLGVNFRPIPDISLKLEYFHSRRSADEDSSGVAASLAIKF